MNKIITLLTIVVFFALGFLNFKFFSNDINAEFTTYAVIALIAEITTVIYYIYLNKKRITLVIHCKYLALKGEKIRFSMSYLYRIKSDNKYLLVKNSNFGHFQLVGGKYKRLPVTQSILRDKFDIEEDTKLSNGGKMKGDFAFFVPAKNAIKFIDWFNEKKDREISHWREFHEELIATDILPQKEFPYVDYNYVGNVITPIKQTEGWGGCKEILQYDILDLIPSEAQEKVLKKLLDKGDTNNIRWADRELINNLGHDNREAKLVYKIGSHTKWALNMKWSNV